MDNPLLSTFENLHSRRAFLGRAAQGLGRMALGAMLFPELMGAADALGLPGAGPALQAPHFAPRAKQVIYLFQSGGPSHVDLFDYKPVMRDLHAKELPASIRGDQRLTGMTSGQSAYPVVSPMWNMTASGRHRTWISDLLPHTQTIADEICIVKSMYTEAINHDPAITFINTGNQQIGHASLGAWLSYGLGNINQNLPAYIVLLSQGTGKNPGQPIYHRLWGNGYLPSSHQGVLLRPGANPVLYLQNPGGVSATQRRRLLDDLAELNQHHADDVGDPEIHARINAYEMAYRMQTSVPDLTDLSDEPESTFDLYGPEARKPGSYAANCLLARRLIERGVRFVQLFHRGWDQHIAIQKQLPAQCRDVDQASAALVKDLKQRGLLDETLVVWGGEFGRTIYSQGTLGNQNSGRDHHGRCFSVWMAGGGIQPGMEYGVTDDFAYNILDNPVHIRDLNATILHCLGIDHERLTYKFRGLDQKLTGVEEAHVVRGILA
ncbi:MAG: DUF1501 domain-containing protein [Rhodothermales bacterium]